VEEPVTKDAAEMYELGIEAYVYLYPLVTMDVTRRQATNIESGKRPGFGPMNTFSHMREYPTADFKAVVRPNFDALYSSAWLDLTKEPMVVSAPNTGGRYYLLPMLDMWTDVFASPGWRTSGTNASAFGVVPPDWKGRLPAGVEKIQAPTPYVWVIGRTQTDGPKDYEAVHKVQDNYKVTPLSRWPREPKLVRFVKADPTVDMNTPPLDQVNNMPAVDYFKYAAELMKLHPPHFTDWSQLARMKRIGLEAGKSVNSDILDVPVREALEKSHVDALKFMQVKLATLARVANGWGMNTDSMGVYGNFYLKRAIVAMIGLGANQPEDAIYPLILFDADGKPLDGNNNYVLHFEKAKLPPAAFWSITMYDAQGFQAANELNRFAIADRDPLKYNADGSLDLYIQNINPGADKEPNWLPVPKGPVGATMRLAAPKPQALDGRWNPPVIKRAD